MRQMIIKCGFILNNFSKQVNSIINKCDNKFEIIIKMQSSAYPFNQKEHVFDFKVKVNFENGNVSLTAPQIVTPPAYFGNQPGYHQPNHNVYTSPSQYNNPYSHSTMQSPAVSSNLTHINPALQTPPAYQYITPPPPINNPYNSLPPQHQLSPLTIPNQKPAQRNQPIQLVNSSYTSMNNHSSDYSQMINNSMQVIECVLCQKSFNVHEFDQHLELHRNKNNRTQISATNQKNNVSHYAMTQNSFNANNDSILSAQRHNNSRHNQSFNSNSSKHKSVDNDSGFVPNFVPVNPSINQQNHNNLISNSNNNHQQSLNEFSHFLGRIQNPIQAINAQQQTNLSLNSSSHQSLSYSNSQNQSLQRYKDPSQMQSMEQSPNFNQVNNSNGSSFGHHGGNNLIGPSFYHNSSQESSSNMKNGAFVKGNNRFAYNDANNSMGSHHSSNHGEINPNVMVPNVFLPNQSYHSNHSGPQQPSYVSNGSNHSYHSNNSHHSQQYINAQMINNSQQQQYSYQNNSRNSQNSSIHEPSYHSNHSLQNNYITSQPNMSPPQNMMGNFQTIQSRYLNQPTTNSRQLYASQQDFNPIRQSRNGSRQYQEGLFNQNDISSISGSSRRDMSEYSDWSDFNRKQDEKLQGYNSADNSIIKHMQSRKQQQQTLNQKNVYLDRSQSRQKPTNQGFFKKKKDHMIASTASYYDRKFKDQDYSSSDDQQFVNKTGRLSYAQRLKEKRVTDNSRPLELSNTKSGRASKNLKQSTKSINSEDSSLSKTKLPVNYLAREEFISTSSTSKSTHKTNLPN